MLSRPDEELKTCFVIAPIGTDGSEVRVRSDQVLKHIIAPAARECGYRTVRADELASPGLITSHIINHIVNDPLVIADLTGRNPNVFYELALRHAVKKPVVQLIHASETIPFDVAASRTIHVDHHNLDSVAKAKEEIVRQIRTIEADPGAIDSPISAAIELQSLRKSDNPFEKRSADIVTMLQEIREELKTTIAEVRQPKLRLTPGIIDDLMLTFERYRQLADEADTSMTPAERSEELQRQAARSSRLLAVLCMEAGIPVSEVRRRLFQEEATLQNDQ